MSYARPALASVVFFCAAAVHAADPLPQVFSCGKQGIVGGLGSGTDLTRYVVDTSKFRDAICNDGTPAIFYYASATRIEDRNKWIIFLQGGGSCIDAQTCAQRWCSIDTSYGFDKMSTSVSKPQIRGVGFLDPDPKNNFGSWNRVLIYYCSSDSWSGDAARVLTASLDGGATREYAINFKGAKIIDAVLDTLRYASPGVRRRAARHDVTPDAEESPWPDLDHATGVIFAGASAGGGGVQYNLDRAGAKLKATNPGLDFRGIIDAAYGTLGERRDWSGTTYCANDPAVGCRYDTFSQATRAAIDKGLYNARDEESCAQWHAANQPGTEWRCSDKAHLTLHHLSTPFFIHQDMQDPQVGGNFVDPGFGTPSDFAIAVTEELGNMPVPEEPRGATPGVFVPQCTDHESFTTDAPVFRVRIAGTSWHDAVWNWWTGAQPQQLVRPFTGTPGKAPECP